MKSSEASNQMDKNNDYKENDKIYIDISHISDAQSFDDEEMIQKDAKKIFLDRLEKFIKNGNVGKTNKSIVKNDQCFELERYHNTILIDGERGAGKTSFALSIRKYLNDNKDIFKVEDLGIMDPTISETKENIFLNIIMRISNTVKINLSSSSTVNCNDDYLNNNVCEELDDNIIWRKSLMRLASGLSLLDGIGSERLKSEIWDSPELIMEEGLKNAKNGEDLERNFHHFIEKSLNILRKDAFILFLDDIDTSADKGFIMLEILRKYMTNKKFIIVLLGDLGLYSILVRQLQWKKIDLDRQLKNYEHIYEFNDNGKDSTEEICNGDVDNNIYRKYIDNLQDQYLVKILKPENRIFLKNINYLKTQIHVKYTDIKGESGNENQITQEIEHLTFFLKNKLIKDMFKVSNADVKIFENYICSITTRSFLQLLLLWDTYLKDIKDINKYKNISDFIFNLQGLFSVYLQDMNDYNLADLDDSLINRFSMYLLKYINCIESTYNFLPVSKSKKYNTEAFFLNCVYSGYLEIKKFKIIEYFIKIGLIKKCLEQVYDYKNNINGNKAEIVKLISHFRLDNSNISSIDIVKIAAGYFQGNAINPKEMSFGYIHINYYNYVKIISKGEKSDNFFSTMFFNLILSKNKYQQSGNYIYASFFSILGIISDILCIQNENTETESNDISENVIEIFRKYFEIPVYESPFSKTSNPIKEEISENIEIESDIYFKTIMETEIIYSNFIKFIKAIAKWVEFSKKLKLTPVSSLCKMWMRFDSNIEDVIDQLKNKNESVANGLHRYIISFLNAVLVETLLDEGDESLKNFIIKNPVINDSVFDKYFDKKGNNNDSNKYSISFLNYNDFNKTNTINAFNFIFSCPIWGIYLNNLNNVTNESLKESAFYYLNLQRNFYDTDDINLILDFYKKLNISNILNDPDEPGESLKINPEKQKINFKNLSDKEQAESVKKALSVNKTTIETAREIVKESGGEIKGKLNTLINNIVYILRHGFKEVDYIKVNWDRVANIIKNL